MALLPVSMAATAYDFQFNDICYNIISRKDRTVEVTKNDVSYYSYFGDIVIPTTVVYDNETYTVIAIGESTFYIPPSFGGSITSVSIPSSVTSIGESAFENCHSLTSVTIPNSVTSIGESAFYNCSNLTSVTIPSSITEIKNYTFCNCSNLTSVTIPSSVTTIGQSAFKKCSGLTSVTIPNSVTSIGESAFLWWK